ncbi:glycerol kinase GlpK [Epibacterium sp. SM1969]|uniref:Glycerol kinase n=1 Tax=Tritonibacter aquimaris TaxID=2663379 RepID=A0A844ANA7_9RHOB|nr:glycerol kinase GlpK [Tritonibacter aquimaris]MQY41693.1 glycerol kinase GlpK [Tritonibacter aquimaris]
MKYVLAIDQGTTSTRAILFDTNLTPVFTAQEEFQQIFPHSGWVEHKADDLWQTTLRTCRQVIEQAGGSAADIISIGITNQRETTVVWDAKTGEAIYNAIVWQDRRTSDLCRTLTGAGHAEMFQDRTGLLVDPYFSATKLKWVLDNVEGARARAQRGELLFGTVDSFLIWQLTEGRVHATDATNAARTMLYDIRKGRWSQTICDLLEIPMNMLPTVKDSADDFGSTSLLGADLPIRGVAGDQQAATVGQACFEPGMLKSTYGTGCFALLNTGDVPVASKNRLLTTIAYQLDGKPTYALEGSIFVAGAVVQWLRDGLKIIQSAGETQNLAENADPTQSVVMVPAFTGLGAPYWSPDSRGAIFGLTRNSGPAEFAKAALESVGYQTRDLIDAMRADWQQHATGSGGEAVLRVDGGMSASDWTMQFLADITNAPVDRPRVLETTALGVAWLAGMKMGALPDQAEFAKNWALERRFAPEMQAEERAAKYGRWQQAVQSTLTY